MDNIFFDISPFLSHCKFAAKGIEGMYLETGLIQIIQIQWKH
jgi:hypothetical protein